MHPNQVQTQPRPKAAALRINETLLALLASTLLLLITPKKANAAGPWTSTCTTVMAPIRYDYCVHQEYQSKNPDILYQLHGAGENERAWMTDPHGRAMRTAWNKQNQDAPTVISISFGKFWLLASKNQSPKSGLYEFFINRVIPQIERTYPAKGRRLLFGYSMGGYNSSQLLLKNPELFDKTALGCPALVNLSPYASSQKIGEYIRRTNARPEMIQFMLAISKDHYPNDQAYQQDNPIQLARTNITPQHPPLHISCGDTDGFGFQEGAKLFADIAASKGEPTTWQLTQGGHCTMDESAIAEFLTK